MNNTHTITYVCYHLITLICFVEDNKHLVRRALHDELRTTDTDAEVDMEVDETDAEPTEATATKTEETESAASETEAKAN